MVQYENYSAVAKNKGKNDDGKLEDRLRLVLESAMKPTENLGKISRESLSKFSNRLSSFSPLTYFGKPSCLSPLLCARLGYVCLFLFGTLMAVLWWTIVVKAKKERRTKAVEHNKDDSTIETSALTCAGQFRLN
ncbi:MAG: hypothetical protein SGBAC_005990, partial [Bacillariaceae sp.]